MRQFVLLFAALTLVSPAVPHAVAGDTRPNVILILVDDLGWMDLSCQGSDFYRTPNNPKHKHETIRAGIHNLLGRNPGEYSIIRQGDWKLIKFWEGPRELYNLKNDLAEEKDLSETMPDKVAALEALLDQRLKSQEASLPRPNPDYAEN